MSVNNLGAVLHAQCEQCKKIRQFTVNLIRERIDDDGYLIDQRNVVDALTALGWRYCIFQGGRWLCNEACWNAFHAP